MCLEVKAWLQLGACSAWLFVQGASAQALSRDTAAALARALDADELTLAATVARLGDDAVLAGLAQDKDSVLRLAATRATSYLRNRELALEPLTALAEGRDPELAPAAARRLLAIAQALALEDSSARELSPREFQPTEERLMQLSAAATARRDIRLCAGAAAQLLRSIRVGTSGL
jgi:hypothetical protein